MIPVIETVLHMLYQAGDWLANDMLPSMIPDESRYAEEAIGEATQYFLAARVGYT